MIPIKSFHQIEKMRAACGVAGEVLARLVGMVRPGITTGEIDAAAGDWMKEAGCRSAFLGYRGFPGQICISVNDQVVHGIGGSRKIQYGEIVKLDVGVIKEGWVGDNATTVTVGVLAPRTQQLLEVTRQALDAGIAEAREGRRLGDLCSAIEEVVLANGFTVVREFVGHGVGRKLHEEPQIPNFGRRNSGPRLREGMTLAIEPMVNEGRADVRILSDGWTVVTSDNKPSAHFEHTVLVKKTGPEILTWQDTNAYSLKP